MKCYLSIGTDHIRRFFGADNLCCVTWLNCAFLFRLSRWISPTTTSSLATTRRTRTPKRFSPRRQGAVLWQGIGRYMTNATWMDRWALNELTALTNGRDQGRTESSIYVASLLKRLQNNKIELESGKIFHLFIYRIYEMFSEVSWTSDDSLQACYYPVQVVGFPMPNLRCAW